MKYTVTYSCGHSGIVELYGRTKDRQYILEQISEDICPGCAAKKESELNTAFSNERKLPELQGTERQVPWANKIRRTILQTIEEQMCLGRTSVPKPINADDARLSEAYQYLCQKSSSSFWINVRKQHIQDIVASAINEIQADKDAMSVNETEILACPEDVENKKDSVVKIRVFCDRLLLEYPKDNDFIAIMKTHRCRWNGKEWEKEIRLKNGDSDDIAAEIGRHLLADGFTVSFPSQNIKDMAIAGNYTPERTRWIQKDDDTHVFISWTGRNDKLYRAALNIRSARYQDRAITVSADYYEDIEAFAENYGFWISPKAQAVLDKCRICTVNQD